MFSKNISNSFISNLKRKVIWGRRKGEEKKVFENEKRKRKGGKGGGETDRSVTDVIVPSDILGRIVI